MPGNFRLEGDINIMGPGFSDRDAAMIMVTLTYTRHDGEIGLIQRTVDAQTYADTAANLRKKAWSDMLADAFRDDGRMSASDKNFLRQVIARWAAQVDWESLPTKPFYQIDNFVETRL